ncbi:MAG: tetratricopeptide repeat protein, partial [Candidatus Altiarchaeota archaeon]|nr:tetratricopeptide repeat protein [Candidatus Altiarchaeota archaeon]
DKALEEYVLITKYDPKYASPYKNIGLIYYYKGNYTKAAEYWTTFLELKPDDVDAETLRKKVDEIDGISVE